MEEELTKEFANNSFALDSPETAAQCVSLCVSMELKPAELVAKWEVFYLNSRMDDGKVHTSQLDNFRQFLQNERRETFRHNQADLYFYSKNDIDMLLDSDNDDETGKSTENSPLGAKNRHGVAKSNDAPMDVDSTPIAPQTPGLKVTSSDNSTKIWCESTPLTPFSQRANRCTIQYVLNKHLPETFVDERTNAHLEDGVLRRLQPIRLCKVEILGSSLIPGCRFMYDRTEDRFNVLARRIKSFAQKLLEHGSFSVDNHVSLASQECIFVVGMVCCDGDGHLNDKSILLQGSVEHSGGHRVRLEFHNLPQFSLFPGQIVGVEGRNPSGHCLVVSRVVDSVPVPSLAMLSDDTMPMTKRQNLDWSAQASSNHLDAYPISMVIAAGPFTTSDNLTFEPLVELLSFARKKRPNVLLLMGPFVDSEHPYIKLGMADRSFKQIFQEEILARVEEYCNEMGIGARVILVPSTRDAHHDAVFPQPRFDRHGLEDQDCQITLLSNPGLFQLNEITIGCCTMDVLRHLSSEEVSRFPAGASSDRLARLAAHIIGQQSFYPLFPAASGVPLDLSLSPDALSLPFQPHILLLPSDLAPFVKVLPSSIECFEQNGAQLHLKHAKKGCNSICINPGRLAKGINGGTFADLFSLPLLLNDIQGQEQGFEQRTRVSIVKI